jgi:hypothetical protein
MHQPFGLKRHGIAILKPDERKIIGQRDHGSKEGMIPRGNAPSGLRVRKNLMPALRSRFI